VNESLQGEREKRGRERNDEIRILKMKSGNRECHDGKSAIVPSLPVRVVGNQLVGFFRKISLRLTLDFPFSP